MIRAAFLFQFSSCFCVKLVCSHCQEHGCCVKLVCSHGQVHECCVKLVCSHGQVLCVMVFAFGFVLWMLALFLWCRRWFWFDIVGVISVLWHEWHLWFVLWMSPLVLCCECHLWLHGVGAAFVRMMWMSRLVLW